MTRFCFLPLAGVPFLLLQGAHGASSKPTADPADCLPVMNEARNAVGFPNFTAVASGSLQLTAPSSDTAKKTKLEGFWSAVCAGKPEPEVKEAGKKDTPEGTFAYFPQSKKDPECAAAVEYWKSGFSSFGTNLPPVYSKAGDQGTPAKPYDLEKAVSFVALYSPKPTPTAECAVVTCPKETTETPERALNAEAPAYVLLCVTTPPALEDGQAPYKEDQWKKISDAFTSSASAAAPTFMAVITAAAVGLALF